MPNNALVVPDLIVTGRWNDQQVSQGGTLHGSVSAVKVVLMDGKEFEALLANLTDATWRDATLTLYIGPSHLELRGGGAALGKAWAQIVHNACGLPEMARGMRTLATSRGGPAELQKKFFGPLLIARRQLAEPEAIDWRVARFDGTSLRERLKAVLLEIARERYPDQAPHRRALEAHLTEAAEPLLAQLSAVDGAATLVRTGSDGTRFVAWRRWAHEVKAAFRESDRTWLAVVAALEQG